MIRATTPAQDAQIAALYAAGLPIRVISARFFVSRFVIRQVARVHGVPPRPRGRPQVRPPREERP